MQTNLFLLSLDLISRSPYQMRRVFNDEEIDELAASIARYGLLHPLTVRPIGDGKYELISGERRLRALLKLGKKEAPCILRKGESEATTAEIALTENLQRVDLSPIEIAHSYRCLMERFSLTQEELAFRLGTRRSSVTNFLRLLNLPIAIQNAIDKGEISHGHGKVLLSTKGQEQEALFNKIRAEKLPVKRASSSLSKEKDPNLASFEQELCLHFGRRVSIQPKGSGGTLTFEWEDLESLQALLESFGVFSHD